MAKNNKETKEPLTDVIHPIPAEGPVDMEARVKVKVTGKAPHHKEGTTHEMHPTVAAKMEANGWGAIVKALLLVMLFSFGAKAQTSFRTATSVDSVVVTNATTGVISVRNGGDQKETTVINLTTWRVSGTTAGTITLLGSVDGINYAVVPNPDTQTPATTITATNTLQKTQYTFRLAGNPYLYYRLSYTGSGTMVVGLKAKILSR